MADSDDDVNYDNSHRAFLQAFLARSILTFEDAKPILAAIQTAQDVDRGDRTTLPEDITEADFRNYISSLNSQLFKLDYEIRSSLSQNNHTRIYALVNTASDPVTQLATSHTPDEIAFAKRLLDAMFETYNTPRREIMALNDMQAMNLARTSRQSVGDTEATQQQTQGSAASSLTLKDAERVLKELVEEGWFERSRRGFYTLSPRGLMELREWLVETYNEPLQEGEEQDDVWQRIKLCEACREIVTLGQRCPNSECQCRLHNHCTQNFFRAHNGQRCPKCRTEWTGDHFVGEKAARAGNAGRRSNGAGPSRSSAVNGNATEEGE